MTVVPFPRSAPVTGAVAAAVRRAGPPANALRSAIVTLASRAAESFTAIGLGVFAALTVALAFLPTGYAVARNTISMYALGPYGELLRIALVSLGVGSLRLGLTFWSVVPGYGGAILAGLSAVWSTGSIIDAAVDTNPIGRWTVGGEIHIALAGLSLLALVLAASVLLAVLWARIRRVPRLVAAASVGVFAAAALECAITGLDVDAWAGAAERAVFASSIAWMLAALRLIKARSPQPARAPWSFRAQRTEAVSIDADAAHGPSN